MLDTKRLTLAPVPGAHICGQCIALAKGATGGPRRCRAASSPRFMMCCANDTPACGDFALAGPEATCAPPPSLAGEIARARSSVEAAQSELHTIQLKLAPLRQQERRALEKLAGASATLRALEGLGPDTERPA